MVREEQAVLVRGGVVATKMGTVVEGEPRDRRAPGRAALARYDLGAVVVGVVRPRRRARRIQALALIDVEAVEGGAAGRPLITRPAKIGGGRRRGDAAVDLLPRTGTDVADPDFGGAGPEREPEGVSQPIGDHATPVGIDIGR